MKNIHIRLEYGEAIDTRRELLSSQVNLLEFLKRFKEYKSLKRRELILKSRLKNEIAFLREEMNKLQEAFPKEETEEELETIRRIARKKYKEVEIKEKEEGYKDIETQLRDIKEKLAKLG